MLRRGRVGVREHHAVEREVPGGVPGVFPLVRHRQEIVVVEVAPAGVPPRLPHRGRRRLGRIAVEPRGDGVVVELLAPDHSREGLSHDVGLVFRRVLRPHGRVVLVGLADAVGERPFEARAEIQRLARIVAREPHPQLDAIARRDHEAIPARHLRALPRRVDGRIAGDDVVVDAVLGVGRPRGRAVETRHVGLVLAEQELRRPAGGVAARAQPPAPELFLLGERARLFTGVGTDPWSRGAHFPGPSVPEP